MQLLVSFFKFVSRHKMTYGQTDLHVQKYVQEVGFFGVSTTTKLKYYPSSSHRIPFSSFPMNNPSILSILYAQQHHHYCFFQN